jgi:hypothetical protein
MVSQIDADAMVRRGKAIRENRVLRLTGIGVPHPCRTRVSCGGVLAAAGMSQRYTRLESRTHTFKFLAPEDFKTFQAATLGADV